MCHSKQAQAQKQEEHPRLLGRTAMVPAVLRPVPKLLFLPFLRAGQLVARSQYSAISAQNAAMEESDDEIEIISSSSPRQPANTLERSAPLNITYITRTTHITRCKGPRRYTPWNVLECVAGAARFAPFKPLVQVHVLGSPDRSTPRCY